MDIRSASITADILNCISDGKTHTMQEIASELEVSERTIRRHIQSLAYRYPIETFCGGINRGGVKLDTKYMVQGKVITNDKLQLINSALRLLQESGLEANQELLKELIRDFAPPTRIKENEDEDSSKLYS